MKEKDDKIGENLWFLSGPAQFLADVATLCAAFFIAYLPAVNIQLGDFYAEAALRQLPLVVLVQITALFIVGANSIIWRYVSIEDIKVFQGRPRSRAVFSSFFASCSVLPRTTRGRYRSR
jgi:hypothetical protein